VDKWVAMSRRHDVAFVANTDLKEEPGTHWVLFYMPQDLKRRPFFFDSFGRDPPEMGRPLWNNYLAAACRRRGGDGKWDDKEHPLQDPTSSVCGQLCAMALCRLARGKPIPSRITEDRILSFLNKMKTRVN
jgi:hypothetical protein